MLIHVIPLDDDRVRILVWDKNTIPDRAEYFIDNQHEANTYLEELTGSRATYTSNVTVSSGMCADVGSETQKDKLPDHAKRKVKNRK